MSAPGTQDAATTAPIPVTREVDEDNVYVTIDLTKQTDLLTLLARAVCQAGLLTEFSILGRSEHDARRVIALRDLLSRQDVRDALTLTLHGQDAEKLGDRLSEAGTDLACAHCGHRAAAEGSVYCPRCQVGVDALDDARAS
jgi:hypothetical protein